MDEFY